MLHSCIKMQETVHKQANQYYLFPHQQLTDQPKPQGQVGDRRSTSKVTHLRDHMISVPWGQVKHVRPSSTSVARRPLGTSACQTLKVKFGWWILNYELDLQVQVWRSDP